MSKPVVEVQVRAVAATSGGYAVFLGNEDKVFVMFVDQSVGTAIAMFMEGTQKERPLTRDRSSHCSAATCMGACRHSRACAQLARALAVRAGRLACRLARRDGVCPRAGAGRLGIVTITSARRLRGPSENGDD